jgi:predicted nucleic-acid-binding protein
VTTLKILLSTIEFDFENHELAFLSILEFETSTADYSDILIGLINQKAKNVLTYSFDQKALKSKYFKCP